MAETEPSVGLSVIRAREAPIAVVFRRGPTKQVRMIRWRLDTDEFERGQWLAGRIYPERCDVSPDGQLVIYFAMRRGATWNAICRPPHFTPLAVWEEGGTWGGGGVWLSNTELRLRANPAVMPLDPKFTLPSWLVVAAFPPPGFDRDGWRALADSTPYTGTKPHARIAGLVLHRRPAPPARAALFPGNTDRDAYAFHLVDRRRDNEIDLGCADWMDWHPSGDLSIAREGTITRVPIEHHALGAPRVIADFTADVFERLAPAPWATAWPAR